MRSSATAASILGRPVTKSNEEPRSALKIKPEWQKYYTRLIELREQLMRQIMNYDAEFRREEMTSAVSSHAKH